MTKPPFTVTHVNDVPSYLENDPIGPEWKPLRHHLGIEAFGANVYVARPGEPELVNEHDEAAGSSHLGTEAGHEELYFVIKGEARFTVDGETVDAPAGTFVFVREPSAKRSATTETPGTTILAVGGARGEAFKISRWEEKYTRELEG
ncbi:MAG: cupin domain-containing protein [Actinomycetota bacterium]|nr:cupin domain-containing protein [Actinomycetota bacterium]